MIGSAPETGAVDVAGGVRRERRGESAIAGPLEGPRSRRMSLRISASALVASRVAIWAAAVIALLVVGLSPEHIPLELEGITHGNWHAGEVLAAPALRWDGDWYYGLAQHGYLFQPGQASTPPMAFFPLYPLLTSAATEIGLSIVLAGILVSLASLLAALYGIHRLATLELAGREVLSDGTDRGARAASVAVLLVAFAPMSVFLSALYAESLLLALAVGCVLFARRGQWVLVGILGALAGATRSSGLLLLLPALAFYFYGPRADRPPDRTGGLAPRYRVRPDVLWLALIPSLFVAFCLYLHAHGASLLAPFDAEHFWYRSFAGPFSSLWLGLPVAWHSLLQLTGIGRDVVGRPAVELYGLAFAVIALAALVGVAKLLPVGYWVYALAAIFVALSAPVQPEPLTSVPRYLLPIFPLFIWGGWALAPRRRLTAAVVGISAALMMLFAGMFAVWEWVA